MRDSGMTTRQRVRATFALHGGEMTIAELQAHLRTDGIRVSDTTCREALSEDEDEDGGLPFALPLPPRRRRA